MSNTPRRSRFHRSAVLAACLTVGSSLVLATPAQAANHPERKWLVKESAHFSLHYYSGLENTALRILHAAEEAYPKLAADFGVSTAGATRIPIIINQDSFFNGHAEPMKDRIVLDPVLASSSVIGTKRFMAHELAHVMTFRAVDKGNTMAKLNNLGGLPTWFLEGIAQYTTEYWYPSNDRMLRLHALEDEIMTQTERANFRMHGVYGGANGYNEGYAITRYMFDTYGKDKLRVLMTNLKEGKRSYEQAIEATFGATMTAIEAGWRQSVRETYKKQVAGLQDQVPGATKLIDTYKGEVNVQPKLSPDGKRMAYLTSRYQDSFLYLRGNVMGFLSLYVSDPDGKHARMIPVGKGAVNGFGWSPDSSRLVYSRVVRDANGNPGFDLYLYDMKSRKTERLTTGENANTMAWHPDGKAVAFVSVHDGQNVIKTIDVKTKKVQVLFQDQEENQYLDPAWSPDGKQLVLVTHKPGGPGHLVSFSPETKRFSELTKREDRVRDSHPAWTPDGKQLIFTSDRGGMTNLYRLEVATRALTKLTNTYRGAETPSLSPDGKTVYFTSYRAKGSMIYKLPLGKVDPMPASVPQAPEKAAKVEAPNQPLKPADGPEAQRGLSASLPISTPGKGLLDEPLKPAIPESGFKLADSKPYEPTLTNDLLVPQMASDERGQQIGLAGIYSDILDKHQLAFDVRYGIMSQRFSYNLQYLNRMGESSWMVNLFDTPQIGLSPDVGQNGSTVYDALYFMRQRGLGLAAQTPLGPGRTLISGANFGTLSTLYDPRLGNYGQLREGQLNSLSLGYYEQAISPTIDQDINPSDGYRLGATWTMSDAMLGSDYNFSQYILQGERYFSLNPELRHNLTWRFSGGLINGDAAMPFLLGGANQSSPVFALRGYAVGAMSGNRIATTGVEYTAPILTHIDKMWGPLYLDRLYVAGFFDTGAAWNQGAQASPFASTGLELRLRTSVMSRQMLTLRIGLAQRLGSSDWPGLYITF